MKVDFEKIKATTDLVRVIQSYGIELKGQGKDLVGLCPFHDDHNPSLRVTPAKGLFRCPACGATGNVIQFVARKENLTPKEAAQKLLTSIPGVTRAVEIPSTPRAPDSTLLKRVVSFYSKTLLKDRRGLECLKSRRLDDPAMLETFQIGYCNGTLKQTLPEQGELVEQLKALGILNEKGNEIFYNRITVPIFDQNGNVVGLYGRHVTDENPKHLYLKGEHKGVFNSSCARTSQSLFITEAIFDALSLWQAGFKNVISLYGAGGWTVHHEKLIQENNITELILALDNDQQGRAATESLKEKLSPLVQSIQIIQWPVNVKDANDFFLSRSSADFEKLLPIKPPSLKIPNEPFEIVAMTPEGFSISFGQRRYELFSIEKPSASRLKATVKAVASDIRNPRPMSGFHIDTIDFYLSRSRRAFILEAARLFKDLPETIEEDLNKLILELETYLSKKLSSGTSSTALVAESDKLEALRMGKNPQLIEELQRDFDQLGLIGEKTNRLLLYLAMASRKMEDPLAVQILSSSGAGKSYLQDTVLSLCPEEDLIKLTSLTDQALFYKGEDSLKHKALSLAEVAGADGARYPLRNLISEKKLIHEATVKNPLTGRLETQLNVVYGPTAVFETTTNPDTDPETKSRYILLSVDESPEQTRAILQAQRNSHTLEGRKNKKARETIQKKHHAFQRLLKPLCVINPFEPLLEYGDDRLLFRRDHPKYLNLILAVTFLHQMQRPLGHDPVIGDFIETTLDDIKIANEVARELFSQSLDDLSVPTRRALRQILDHVQTQAKVLNLAAEKIEFSRRQLRQLFGWSETRTRVYLRELAQMEYIASVAGKQGQRFAYRLIYSQEPEQIPALKSVEELAEESNFAAFKRFAATSPLQNGEVQNAQKPKSNGSKPTLKLNLAALAGGLISKNNGTCVDHEILAGRL